MELLALLLGKRRETSFFAKATKGKQKTIADYQREALVREGGKQFQMLIEKGLRIPVAHL